MKIICITRKSQYEISQLYESLENDINGLIINYEKHLSLKYQAELGNNTTGFVLSFNDDQVYNLYFKLDDYNKTYELVNIVADSYEIRKYEKRDIIDKIFIYIKSIPKGNSAWSIRLLDDYKNLKSIISSSIARDQFLYTFKNYTNSNNIKDVQKYDQFICWLYRYSRKKIETDRLYEYFRKKMNFDKNSSIALCERIDIGFSILDVYNRKYEKE